MRRGLVGALGAGLGLAALLALSVYLQLDSAPATGPYAVGRTTRRWIDPARPEPLTEAPGDFREVMAEIWYPAEAGTGLPAPYFPDLERLAPNLAASGEVSALEVFGLRYIRSHSRLEARVAGRGRWPVVLLSPGNGTNVEFYAGLADDLASHGYVVVGLNHPYDVAAVARTDGQIAQFVPGPQALAEREPWVAERVAVRAADALFVLKQLAALDAAPADSLAGRLDLDHAAIMGHSLGGLTAAQACRAEPRLRACLNLDGLQRGGPFSVQPGAPPPDQAFMFITKEAALPAALRAQFEAVRAGSYRVVLTGARHDSFTDGPLLTPALLPIAGEAERLLALTRTYCLAFFDQTLKDQPSPLLAGPRVTAEAALEVFPAN